ncbi:hypothetical protein [Roseovarius sp. M141]|uniref:hypothetical protein n=1 Tax=Roseovarius sp. M141 TaxID=2583806 RepID=UPI0020CE8B97|nr:hypothetical protein [Roseovarius sp. M141]MCQ0093847.1 hypothetical protein [Roseovarius sp. M141]
MIDPVTFQKDIDAMQVKLRTRLGARGKTLAHSLHRARRSLPGSAQQAGARLVQMQAMVAHPRLRRLVARAQVDAALSALNAPLATINVKERRKDRLLGLAGSVVFNLLILGAAIIAFMLWRGLL